MANTQSNVGVTDVSTSNKVTLAHYTVEMSARYSIRMYLASFPGSIPMQISFIREPGDEAKTYYDHTPTFICSEVWVDK